MRVALAQRRRAAYLAGMWNFLRSISPKRAVGDFAETWRQPTPHRWQILGVACAATFCVFMLFIPKSEPGPPEQPELVYISTFADGRSDPEIVASNCANQELQDEIALAIAENEERRRELYAALGRATFLDVDEMEREAAAQRAAEAEMTGGPSEEELALSIEEYCARASG
ncbi:hypothetical protein GRI62_10920 [Erythrobacter arachoides]|uniref:Uncharacterized protein n=1 Tax=Aurantiacibacter arachoides TaxID=1850444 RepID=A0A845A597_9SPHN|nr:hypothetical protein [Aurantiacibacter arachoides]MXO94107.1 hypothetical protein [Aurantiacibacter arachoides]GGD65998.1 hypothetical protein GCM10011411_28020 [Aurantiacibacter arachoides]